MKRFIINNREAVVDCPPGRMLLDVIKESFGLRGTREACREGECGACTVLIGRLSPEGISYRAVASCILPAGAVEGCHIVTVEGLSEGEFTLVQQLIIENSASQCGYCTPGIVLSLTGFCLNSFGFSYEDAIDALDGNICRCTGYVSIRNAARALSNHLSEKNKSIENRIDMLIEEDILPEYFRNIEGRLKVIYEGEEKSARQETENAVIVGGGTDLFVQKPEELEYAKLDFLQNRKELNYIKAGEKELRVGGAVTIEDFRRADIVCESFPFMKEQLLFHSSSVLRTSATLAGNIINASPIGDVTIMLLVLGASLIMNSRAGVERTVLLEDFFLDYKKTDLEEGEVLTEIIIPFIGEKVFSFEKVSNRVYLDIAAVNTAMLLLLGEGGEIKELSISAGGVAPVPFLISGLDKFRGCRIDYDTVQNISSFSEAQAVPIDDIRGSAEYKKKLFVSLVKAHFLKLLNKEG